MLDLGLDSTQQEGSQDFVELGDDLLLLFVGISLAFEPRVKVIAGREDI